MFAQNYALKFEQAAGFFVSNPLDPDVTHTTDGADMEGDDMFEVIVENDDSLLVFDGSSYQLEWQFTKSFGTDAWFYGFYDIDADGVREAIFTTKDPTRRIYFIDPQTNSIEFTLESLTEDVNISNILDLNNDGFYELIVSFVDINTYDITKSKYGEVVQQELQLIRLLHQDTMNFRKTIPIPLILLQKLNTLFKKRVMFKLEFLTV